MRISDWSSDVCSSDLRQPALADAVADAAPQARRVELLRQAGDMRQALALVLDEDRERIERPAGLAVDLGRRGVRLALVVAATAHRQAPSSSLMRAISATSDARLAMVSRAPWGMPQALAGSHS